jgi:hypothetical protein
MICPKSETDFIKLREEYFKAGLIGSDCDKDQECIDFILQKRFSFLGIDKIEFSIVSPLSHQFG